MFTGLVSDVGEIVAAEDRGSTRRLRIACTYPVETIAIGASIACSGPCLTAVARGLAGNRTWFDIDAGAEDAGADNARRVGDRPPHQPRALAEARRRTWRAIWSRAMSTGSRR